MAMPELVTSDRTALLSDPALRAELARFVRGRVPDADIEDVVQATLTDAFAAKQGPSEAEEIRRWVFGIAKNKIVDVHRKAKREVHSETPVGEETAAESAPLSARDLLRWAEKELPEAEGADSTLEWMLREGSGEKLEHIAEDAELPPARVRQRVSRMRRYFRTRWAAQLAAAAALLILVFAIWAIWRGRATPGPEDIAREKPTPEDQARELRRVALERCDQKDWKPCLDGLDRAKDLDPVGDTAERIQQAREAASRGLGPEPKPEPSQNLAPVPTDAKQKAPPLTSSEVVPIKPPAPKPPAPKPPPGKTGIQEKGSSLDPGSEPQQGPTKAMPKKAGKGDFGSK